MIKYKGIVLATVLTAILWLVYFSLQLRNADQRNYGGDGFKNYYTLAYYLRHDSGPHFSGMNYPYGENVPFTDNQPALAWILKPLVLAFPAIADHIRLILISLIFLSVIISALFTFKTLRQFEIPQIPAALFAVLISMLAPQIQRLAGHFSLAYTCFLPIVIYLLLRCFKTKTNFKYFLWLGITLTFFAFIHIYYLAMAGMFVLLTAFFYAMFNRKNINSNFRFLALLSGSAIVPVLILKSYLLITDNVTDRPSAPWGFVASRSTIADILLHHNSFTGKTLAILLPNARIVYHWEGDGYIGLIAVITLFISLVIGVNSIRKKRKLQHPLLQYPLNIFFPAAFVVLLFAMAFPFCFDFFEKYFDLMPAAIKQFRASGRFSWVFYYIATLTTSVILYRVFNNLCLKNKIAGYTFLAAVCTVWFIEVNMISNYCVDFFNQWVVKMDEPKEAVRFNNLLKSVSRTASDFQAILPLPFFLNGSEKLYITSGMGFNAMNTSILSGIPIACGEMSRTSLSQTLKLANLLSNELIRKDIITDYPNQKPLLLITIDDHFKPEEWKLINQAHYLFSFKNVRCYELPLTAFTDSVATIQRYFADNRSKFIKHKDYWSTDSVDNVFIQRYEDEPKYYAVFGKGAHYSRKEDLYFLYDTLPKARDNAEYVLSIWMYSDKRVASYPEILVSQSDSTGKTYGLSTSSGSVSTNTFDKWVRVQISFTLFNHKNKVCVAGHGTYATYDELLIRPKQVNVVSAVNSDSSFNYNNFPIR